MHLLKKLFLQKEIYMRCSSVFKKQLIVEDLYFILIGIY